MFLRKVNRIRKTVGFRLAFWFCAIFILTSLLLFSLGYFLFSSSLKKQDKASIELKIEELSALYQSGGLDQLKKEITIDKKFVERNPFLIRLADNQNRTLVLILPYQWLESDLKQLEAREFIEGAKRIRLPIGNKKYGMEVDSVLLNKSCILQVGKSNEERGQMLSHFRKIFYSVMIPLFLFGFVGGVLVSNRTLLPIRNLISTLKAIESGDMEARVAGRQSNDELDELVLLFNNMLERIESLMKGMRDALDNIAHNLRTPMTRFRGIAERAMQTNQTDESCEEALGSCLEESDQILKMLNTLMDISEAETGTIKLDIESTEVSMLINRVLDLYQYVAEDKGIQFHFSAGEDLYMDVDQSRMGQALSNLIDNAIKYSPENSPIDIETFKDDDRVIIRIKDRGIGIHEEELPRIYDRLFRGKEVRTQRGLGLGLNLVKAIVEAHEGLIEIASKPGKGSTFSIILPSKN